MSGVQLLAPASTQVVCHGAQHRLRWADGVLTALDHDDVDGELALAALGGNPTRCAEIVSAWRGAVDDLRVLVLASRGLTDRLSSPPPEPVPAAGTLMAVPGVAPSVPAFGSFSYVPMSSFSRVGRQILGAPGGFGPGPEMPPPDPLLALLTLRGGLPERLAATVVVAWADRVGTGSAPVAALPSLVAALTSRVELAVHTWLGDPWLTVDVAMLPPGTTPTLVRAGDAVSVGLPFSWLADVWVPGLTHLLGRFTLAVKAAGRRLTLGTVGAALDRAPLVIELS